MFQSLFPSLGNPNNFVQQQVQQIRQTLPPEIQDLYERVLPNINDGDKLPVFPTDEQEDQNINNNNNNNNSNPGGGVGGGRLLGLTLKIEPGGASTMNERLSQYHNNNPSIVLCQCDDRHTQQLLAAHVKVTKQFVDERKKEIEEEEKARLLQEGNGDAEDENENVPAAAVGHHPQLGNKNNNNTYQQQPQPRTLNADGTFTSVMYANNNNNNNNNVNNNNNNINNSSYFNNAGSPNSRNTQHQQHSTTTTTMIDAEKFLENRTSVFFQFMFETLRLNDQMVDEAFEKYEQDCKIEMEKEIARRARISKNHPTTTFPPLPTSLPTPPPKPSRGTAVLISPRSEGMIRCLKWQPGSSVFPPISEENLQEKNNNNNFSPNRINGRNLFHHQNNIRNENHPLSSTSQNDELFADVSVRFQTHPTKYTLRQQQNNNIVPVVQVDHNNNLHHYQQQQYNNNNMYQQQQQQQIQKDYQEIESFFNGGDNAEEEEEEGFFAVSDISGWILETVIKSCQLDMMGEVYNTNMNNSVDGMNNNNNSNIVGDNACAAGQLLQDQLLQLTNPQYASVSNQVSQQQQQQMMQNKNNSNNNDDGAVHQQEQEQEQNTFSSTSTSNPMFSRCCCIVIDTIGLEQESERDVFLHLVNMLNYFVEIRKRQMIFFQHPLHPNRKIAYPKYPAIQVLVAVNSRLTNFVTVPHKVLYNNNNHQQHQQENTNNNNNATNPLYYSPERGGGGGGGNNNNNNHNTSAVSFSSPNRYNNNNYNNNSHHSSSNTTSSSATKLLSIHSHNNIARFLDGIVKNILIMRNESDWFYTSLECLSCSPVANIGPNTNQNQNHFMMMRNNNMDGAVVGSGGNDNNNNAHVVVGETRQSIFGVHLHVEESQKWSQVLDVNFEI